jgi:hypothetical protein
MYVQKIKSPYVYARLYLCVKGYARLLKEAKQTRAVFLTPLAEWGISLCVIEETLRCPP